MALLSFTAKEILGIGDAALYGSLCLICSLLPIGHRLLFFYYCKVMGWIPWVFLPSLNGRHPYSTDLAVFQDSYPNGRKHHDTFPTCGSKNIDTTTAYYFPWLKAQHKVTLDSFVSLTHHGSNRNDKIKTELLKRADSGMDSGLETTEDDQ